MRILEKLSVVIVIVVLVYHTVVEVCIVAVFVCQTECKNLVDGMSYRQTEHPRRVQAILQTGVVAALLRVVGKILLPCLRVCLVDVKIPAQVCAAGCFQLIPCRGVDISADAERRALNRTGDDAELDVETCAGCLPLIQKIHIAYDVLVRVIKQSLCIVCSVTIVDILQTEREAKIHAVVDVAAHVEGIVCYEALTTLLRCIACGIIVFHEIFLKFSVAVNHSVQHEVVEVVNNRIVVLLHCSCGILHT